MVPSIIPDVISLDMAKFLSPHPNKQNSLDFGGLQNTLFGCVVLMLFTEDFNRHQLEWGPKQGEVIWPA